MSRRLFQTERNAGLFIDVLRSLVAKHKFRLRDFVVMPDHVHLLIELDSEMTIEKAMQFIKGRFSHRLKQEFGHKSEVWQRGYSEKQVTDAESMDKCSEYIAMNPVKAGLAQLANEYPFCFRFLAAQKVGLAGNAEDMQGLNRLRKNSRSEPFMQGKFSRG
ncbi:MAG: transposase [Terracidiphilus sp.]|nr:transposase [Terracidiphilus sp.]